MSINAFTSRDFDIFDLVSLVALDAVVDRVDSVRRRVVVEFDSGVEIAMTADAGAASASGRETSAAIHSRA